MSLLVRWMVYKFTFSLTGTLLFGWSYQGASWVNCDWYTGEKIYIPSLTPLLFVVQSMMQSMVVQPT